jgi:hypothetical protein
MEEISMTASDWTAEMDNIVTSAALIIGGIWAGYRWGYTEWQRKRREQPDLDGTLTASSVPLPGGKAYLTLQAAWRNPGPLPIWMCPEHSFVEQYALPGDPPAVGFRLEHVVLLGDPLAGSLKLDGCPGAARISRIPLTWPKYKMGPNTVSNIIQPFVVTAGSVYVFNWVICLGAISRKNQNHSWCNRDLIWALPQATSAANRVSRKRSILFGAR